MPTLAYNKRANFDYEISDTFEAGIVLAGHEVKSIKTGHISLKGSYVSFKNITGDVPEIYLINAHVNLYKKASTVSDYDTTRSRKLLLKKSQIKKLVGKKQTEGLTLVPIKVYTKRNLIKLEFGVGKGKKKYDKRESIKKKDVERRLRTFTKESFKR